jgi:RING finger/CCCH-type zinc finger protein
MWKVKGICKSTVARASIKAYRSHLNLMFLRNLYVFMNLLQLQTPQSFTQSTNELVVALQRSGDPCQLQRLRPHLEFLASIDPSPGTDLTKTQQRLK